MYNSDLLTFYVISCGANEMNRNICIHLTSWNSIPSSFVCRAGDKLFASGSNLGYSEDYKMSLGMESGRSLWEWIVVLVGTLEQPLTEH